MRFHVFTIEVRDPGPGQDALNAFCAQHRLADVEKRFVDQGLNSYWTFCVATLDGEDSSRPAAERKRIDYREVLNEADFAVYADLRGLRRSLAEHEGVPQFALFTNEQLAAMVTRQVTTAAALGEIEGVGKARVEKYAGHFLPLLRKAFPALASGSGDAARAN
ncbi:HRDC domain-containing protein [Candidatus Accumulibacter contiguus]|jgi:superfamily II DNA helicase RecQ|nr:HRDC domain-containing protein [Candidatus Accumulibacter contiguus]